MDIKFMILITCLVFALVGAIIWKIAPWKKSEKHKEGVSDTDDQIKKKIIDNDKGYLYLDLGISWLSVTLIVLKDRLAKIAVGDKVELSELTDIRDSAMLIHGNAFNLSTKKESNVTVEVLAIDDLMGIISVTCKLC